MKKLFILTVITIFGFTNIHAQFEVHFGSKAGLNLATISGDDGGYDTKMRTAFHAGGFVEFAFTEKFALQPEVLFSSQGTKYESSENFFGTIYKEEGTLKLDYLNIPIMAKFYPVEGLFIEAGPQIGVLLKAEDEYEERVIYSDGGSDSYSETFDVKDNVLPIDFALNLGIGYKLDFGLMFGLRYSLGLLNVNDVDFDYEEDEYNQQNGVLQLSVGYLFQ